jgi:hypothetical protein
MFCLLSVSADQQTADPVLRLTKPARTIHLKLQHRCQIGVSFTRTIMIDAANFGSDTAGGR